MMNVGNYPSPKVMYITCAGDDQLECSLAHEMDGTEKVKELLDFYLQLMNKCVDSQRYKTSTTLNELLQIDVVHSLLDHFSTLVFG